VPRIAVDTGPLVALFNRGDGSYDTALRFFRSTDADFVVNVAVLTEACHLLSFSSAAVRDALVWVIAAFDVDQHTGSDLPRIMEIMAKYADLPADFADASLVAMCERRGVAQIATLDKDFDVYQLSTGERLRNVFRDGE
jgi:predicted nucleic acid-binding protein